MYNIILVVISQSKQLNFIFKSYLSILKTMHKGKWGRLDNY